MLPTNNKQLARRQAAAKFDEVLSCYQPKIFVAIHEAGKFKVMGLRGQRLGPGRYRFVRRDGKPMDSCRASIVAISEPWASERTKVSCSCGWKPSMGGAKCYILPFLKTLLREHQGPGHSVDLRDPFMLMDGVNELPMLS